MNGDLSELYSILILGVFGVADFELIVELETGRDDPGPEAPVVLPLPPRFRTMFGDHS